MKTPLPTQTLLAALLAASGLSPLSAATLYWDAASGSAWNVAGNWSTDLAGDNASGAVPTASDDLIFNSTPFSAANNQASVTVDIEANSITFATPFAMRISQNNSLRSFKLGAGGMTVNSGAGAVTIGESANSLYTDVTASQTWTNNSSSAVGVRRLRASSTATGDVAVTLSANGSGSFSFNNSIEDSLGGTNKLTLIVDSAGTGSVNFLSGGYTGGTTIKRGVGAASGATVGAGTVKLGDTSGSATATLRVTSTTVFTSALIVQANSGTNSLEFTATSSGTVASSITLDGDLTVGVRNVTGGSTFSGVISGAGDLIKGQYQGSSTTGLLTLSGVNTYSGDTIVNVGAFTLADNAALTFYIGTNGTTNQVKGAGSNVATFDGDFIFNLSSANLTNGNSWTIVDVGSLNESFSATFLVQGFTESNNVWTNGAGLSFDEATGILSYSAIPEPSTFALLTGAGVLLLAAGRRTRRSA